VSTGACKITGVTFCAVLPSVVSLGWTVCVEVSSTTIISRITRTLVREKGSLFKKIAFGLMLTLLVASVLTLKVRAQEHDVAVTNILPFPNSLAAGEYVSINVTVENQGSFSETFDVAVYYNNTIIDSATVILGSGNSQIVQFTWDTSGVIPANYVIKAQADIVPGETDTVDNVYVDGVVEVTESAPRGPRMDGLCIKYYNNTAVLFDALKNGEVDLTDSRLTIAQTDQVFNDANIQAAISPQSSLYEFDFNNNATTPTYPLITNPTAYKEFRQGIACLVNKTYIINEICNYSYRIDTPIPCPYGNWWVDWDVSQYDLYGELLGNYPYEYNSSAAAQYFDLSGFVEGNTTNPYYDASFPGSAQYLRRHPETDEDLEPLIFYIRNDSGGMPQSGRLQAGRILRDNLRKLGIPVNATEGDYSMCVTKVMQEGDYHIYTGGWVAGKWAPELLVVYTSEYITEGWMTNYPQFRNATYDELVQKVIYPSDLGVAREAAIKCQKILVEEATCVWLWSPSSVMGYRNIQGVVNSRDDDIDNKWTFLTTRLGANATRTAINYGLPYQPDSLNILAEYPWPSWADRIYDTLLSYNPYDQTPGNVFEEEDRGEIMPWMAENWEIGAWESPYDPGENLTKLSFYLRDGIKWHDGVWLNSTDVKFTIEYLQGLGGPSFLYSSVVDVHHVTTPNAHTVVVYENTSNIRTLDTIGSLPILPKHIFQDIENVTGYTPGASQGFLANQTLIGSGPWKYVFHNSSMLILEANRDYFVETPPEAEIDFRYDWEMGCWAVDTMDMTMAREAYGSSGSGVPYAKWEPGCDITRGDCQVDIFDIFTITQQFNTTWGRSAKRSISLPPTECAIYLDPVENPIVVGENLTVYVKLKNLTQLSGVQFKLYYDPSKLDGLDLALDEIFGNDTFEVKREIEQAKGLMWVSVTSPGPTFPTFQLVSGNATLATITFNATKSSGSTLDLWNTKLASYGAPGLTCQLMTHKTIDRGVTVGVSTPTGTNVTVAPAENANVTFLETTTEGVTTLSVTQPPSDEFGSVICADIDTTANFTGNVTVQFSYDPTGLSLEKEQAMRIWLWNESSQVWIDITTHVYTDRNVVCGVSPHLSIFGVTASIGVGGDIGETTITVGTPETPPDPPPGLIALRYYDVIVTSGSTGPTPVHFEYEDLSLSPEEETFVQLWLWNQTVHEWVDITTSVDIEGNIVHGFSPHLSIFGVTSRSQPPAEIAVTDATCLKTIVGQGYSVNVSYTVWNLGEFTEEFDIILFCNQTTLQTYPVILGPNTHANISFTWDTTDASMGNWALSSCANLIEWVFVTIAGDVDGDRDVDIYDIVRMSGVYGVSLPDIRYDPNSDWDNDGIINIYDIVIAAGNYGKSW